MGRVQVLSVIAPDHILRGNVAEGRWNFLGALLPPDSSSGGDAVQFRMRLVRDNWGRKLCKATPGSILKIEGHFKKFNGVLELHIVRGEIESSATFFDGYQPTQRPHGEWRWLAASKPSQT